MKIMITSELKMETNASAETTIVCHSILLLGGNVRCNAQEILVKAVEENSE